MTAVAKRLIASIPHTGPGAGMELAADVSDTTTLEAHLNLNRRRRHGRTFKVAANKKHIWLQSESPCYETFVGISDPFGECRSRLLKATLVYNVLCGWIF